MITIVVPEWMVWLVATWVILETILASMSLIVKIYQWRIDKHLKAYTEREVEKRLKAGMVPKPKKKPEVFRKDVH